MYYSSSYPLGIRKKIKAGDFSELNFFSSLDEAVKSLLPGGGVYSVEEDANLSVWDYRNSGGKVIRWIK